MLSDGRSLDGGRFLTIPLEKALRLEMVKGTLAYLALEKSPENASVYL